MSHLFAGGGEVALRIPSQPSDELDAVQCWHGSLLSAASTSLLLLEDLCSCSILISFSLKELLICTLILAQIF
jgi:dienelactone hydrolase